MNADRSLFAALVLWLAWGLISVTSVAVAAKSSSAEGLCRTLIDQFLRSPTAGHLSAMQDSQRGDCWSVILLNQIQRLDHLIAAGNTPSATLLAPHVRNLDGGELEDALRAFGQYASHHMPEFVSSPIGGALTDREFADALTMLPLDLSDQYDAQLAEMRVRRLALEQTSMPKFQGRKETALASIDAFIAEIDRARLSVGPQTLGAH